MKVKGYLTNFQISQYVKGFKVWVLSEKPKHDSMYHEVEIDTDKNSCTYESNGMGMEHLCVQIKN